MHTSRDEIIVVGGGLAGLSAACLLAGAGLRVNLYEQAAGPGGRARTRLHAGYAFNLGPHALYTGGAASEVLAELGVGYGPQHGPSGLEVLRGRQFYPLPSTPGALLSSRLLDVGDKLELIRLFMTLPRLRPSDVARVSIQDWIESQVRRPKVRQFLTATARTSVYSAALHLVSADVLIDKLQRSLHRPTHYLDGGWQTLVDGLHRRAEALGVNFLMGRRVDEVLSTDGGVTGVRLAGGGIHPAAEVLLATGPHAAAHLAGPPVARLTAELLPARVASLDVALSGSPHGVHHVIQDLDAPRFLSTQSSFAAVAPEGGTFVTCFKPLDPTVPSDPREHERDLEDLLDTVHPGWRTRLVHRQFLPAMNAVGALPLSRSGGLAGRPGVRVPEVPGLYLAGDWVGDEGFLVDASFASARRAAERILHDKRATAIEGTSGARRCRKAYLRA